ncbi:MAG TPA: hypothetical protein VK907_13485, partial [Phnomibacter sp.]|nr:hypothetical protein [Phnomibacter sp.]
MKTKIGVLAVLILSGHFYVRAQVQVQVSKEPLHKKVLENKYFRLMDVWLKTGDTSMYHIHSTPSVFLYFTNSVYGAQPLGGAWTQVEAVAGHTWYNSFSPDTVVHRVCNAEDAPIHVMDIELTAPFKPTARRGPLPFTILYENERVVAYRLARSSLNDERISGRGPMIMAMVKGSEIRISNAKGKKTIVLKEGDH